MEKTFFDPHPGFAGAAIPIPAAVKKVADELNNKNLPLSEAVAMIQATTKGKVSIRDGWIALVIYEPNGAMHMFRVIRFG